MYDTTKLYIIARLRILPVVMPNTLGQCQADLENTRAQLASVSHELAMCRSEMVRLRQLEMASMFSADSRAPRDPPPN